MYIRSVGFGDSHECCLVSTFVRMELERQDTVLLLYFRQRGALEERQFQNDSQALSDQSKESKTTKIPKRWDSVLTKAKVHYLADKKLWEH